MESLNAIHLTYPTPEHYGAALCVDMARWSGNRTSDAESTMCANAQIMLTNPKRNPADVIAGMQSAVRMLWVMQEAVDANAEPCTDPDCPVHGQKPSTGPGLDLDGVFGADWEPGL